MTYNTNSTIGQPRPQAIHTKLESQYLLSGYSFSNKTQYPITLFLDCEVPFLDFRNTEFLSLVISVTSQIDWNLSDILRQDDNGNWQESSINFLNLVKANLDIKKFNRLVYSLIDDTHEKSTHNFQTISPELLLDDAFVVQIQNQFSNR